MFSVHFFRSIFCCCQIVSRTYTAESLFKIRRSLKQSFANIQRLLHITNKEMTVMHFLLPLICFWLSSFLRFKAKTYQEQRNALSSSGLVQSIQFFSIVMFLVLFYIEFKVRTSRRKCLNPFKS